MRGAGAGIYEEKVLVALRLTSHHDPSAYILVQLLQTRGTGNKSSWPTQVAQKGDTSHLLQACQQAPEQYRKVHPKSPHGHQPGGGAEDPVTDIHCAKYHIIAQNPAQTNGAHVSWGQTVEQRPLGLTLLYMHTYSSWMQKHKQKSVLV